MVPLSLSDSDGIQQVLLTGFSQTLGKLAVIDCQSDFEIENQATGIKVGGPHEGPAAIDRKCFGMQDSLVVLLDFHAGIEQRIIIGAAGMYGRGICRLAGNQQSHMNSPPRC